jgi:hypothetical protein
MCSLYVIINNVTYVNHTLSVLSEDQCRKVQSFKSSYTYLIFLNKILVALFQGHKFVAETGGAPSLSLSTPIPSSPLLIPFAYREHKIFF